MTLSDNITEIPFNEGIAKVIQDTKVKEFIKNLKWNLWEIAWVENQQVNNKMIQKEIDKLTGDNLI